MKQSMLILGGARSGKSRYAQETIAQRYRSPLYLATAEALDDEMTERIADHRRKRGPEWACVEAPLEVAGVLREPPGDRDVVLLDCVTLWLSNVLLKEGDNAVAGRLDDLAAALDQCPVDVIIVSNEVGMGVVPEHRLGRAWRDQAGWMNQRLAERADTVVLVTAGIPQVLKGKVKSS